MKNVVLSSVIAGFLVTSVNAADDGFFGGIDVGYAFASDKETATCISDEYKGNDEDFIYGAKIGYKTSDYRVYFNGQMATFDTDIDDKEVDVYVIGLSADLLKKTEEHKDLTMFFGGTIGYVNIDVPFEEFDDAKGLGLGLQLGGIYSINNVTSLEIGYKFITPIEVDTSHQYSTDCTVTLEARTLHNFYVGLNFNF